MKSKAHFILLFIIQLAFSLKAHAQLDQKASVKLQTGKPNKSFKRVPGELYYTPKGVVSVKAKYWKMYFKKYDSKTLEEKVSGKLKFGGFAFYEGSFYANNKLFIVFSTGVSDGKEEVYCGEIDLETGKWKAEPRLLLATSSRILGSNGISKKGVLPEDKFNVEKSPDGSKLLIKYVLRDEVEKNGVEYSVYGFGVFNSDMQLMWQDEFTLPVADEHLGLYGSEVDDSGNLRMLAMTIEPDPANPIRSHLRPRVFKRALNGDVRGEETFSIAPYHLVHDMSSTVTSNGEVIYSGFCTDHTKNRTAQGVFFARVSADGNILDQNVTPIPLKLINQYAPERTKAKNRELYNKGEGGINALSVRKIKEMDDGGIITIGHQRRTMEDIKSGAKYFIAEEMLVTRFDNEGNVLWMKKIPKDQVSDYWGELTFYHSYKDGDHYILFMDKAENLDLKNDEKPHKFSHRTFGFSDGNLVSYVIKDRSGEVQKTNIGDLYEINGHNLERIFPANTAAEPNGAIYLEANMSIKKDILVKITPEGY